MKTEQARSIVDAHLAADRALDNLRNAAAMAADDSGSAGLLEDAGDAYAVAASRLDEVRADAVASVQRGDIAAVSDVRPAEDAAGPAPVQPPPAAEGAEAPQTGDGQGDVAPPLAEAPPAPPAAEPAPAEAPAGTTPPEKD